MTGSDSPTPFDASAFDRIEAALSGSARGRSFLDELGRRRRGADTERLLSAIARLEGAVAPPGAAHGAAREAGDAPHLRAELAEMARLLAGSRAEIAGGEAGIGARGPGGGFEGLLRASERATSDILAAAEAVQEAAWSLRETGAETELCDVLDRRAVAISAACADQDLTAQRLGRLVRTLDHLEERIAAALARGGRPPRAASAPLPDPADELAFLPAANADPEPAATGAEHPASEAATAVGAGPIRSDSPGSGPAASGPDLPGSGGFAAEDFVTQDFVTQDVASDGFVADDLAAAFPDLDRLSIEEKIALFS